MCKFVCSLRTTFLFYLPNTSRSLRLPVTSAYEVRAWLPRRCTSSMLTFDWCVFPYIPTCKRHVLVHTCSPYSIFLLPVIEFFCVAHPFCLSPSLLLSSFCVLPSFTMPANFQSSDLYTLLSIHYMCLWALAFLLKSLNIHQVAR